MFPRVAVESPYSFGTGIDRIIRVTTTLTESPLIQNALTRYEPASPRAYRSSLLIPLKVYTCTGIIIIYSLTPYRYSRNRTVPGDKKLSVVLLSLGQSARTS